MEVKKLKEIYCVDTLSQDKGWKKIAEAIKGNDNIIIDFTGINVVEPWACIEFKRILSDTNVHMRFTNEEELTNRIKMMCIIDGLNPDRIENIYVEVPKKETPEEKKLKRLSNDIKELIEVVDNVGYIDLTKKYTQLGSSNTVIYIGYAVRAFNKETGVKEYVVQTKDMFVQDNILDSVANLIVSLDDENIQLELDTNLENIQKNMGLHMHKATSKKYDTKAKYEALKEQLKVGTPGMLLRYRKSNALDEFGRQGRGEVVSCRIAIFKGFSDVDDDQVPSAIFDTFNDNYFYTKQHWIIEHDNTPPTSLWQDTVEADMDELGVWDMFLGSKFHFLRAVQKDPKENRVVIVDTDDEGRNIKETCTIPRRMQLVFDDWGVDYDVEELAKDIEQTNKVLGLQ